MCRLLHLLFNLGFAVLCCVVPEGVHIKHLLTYLSPSLPPYQSTNLSLSLSYHYIPYPTQPLNPTLLNPEPNPTQSNLQSQTPLPVRNHSLIHLLSTHYVRPTRVSDSQLTLPGRKGACLAGSITHSITHSLILACVLACSLARLMERASPARRTDGRAR